MSKNFGSVILLVIAMCLFSIQGAAQTAQAELTRSTTQLTQPEKRVLQHFGTLPLSFEMNQGQTDPRVKFLARGKGYTLFLTADEAVLAMHSTRDVRGFGTPAGQSGLFSANAFPKFAAMEPGHAGPDSLRMKIVGGNLATTVTGVRELPGKT